MGDFVITNGGSAKQLTITTRLESEPFPTEPGTEVSVYQVESDSGVKLEVVPVEPE
jgi:hypothetical protein